MARPSTLRTKTVSGKSYWVVRYQGILKYLGRVDEVSEEQARQKLADWLKLGADVEASARYKPLLVSILVTAFTAWLEVNRPGRTHGERKRHLKRFLRVHGDCYCHQLRLADFEDFLARFKNPLWKRHHATSVKAMIRWGRGRYLPNDFNPYAGLSLPALPVAHLVESDLPTDDEIQALLKHADPELGDLIRFYLATGCRTAEALNATVADFSPRSRTIVLAKHKTSRTGRKRTIVLNDDAFEIVNRRAKGKAPEAPIFTTPHTQRGWKMNNLSYFWQLLRTKAGVRETITPYSLRHLWATDAIESGVDLSTVAKMMGSSTAVVERYYAHFRTDSLQEAHRRVTELRRGRSVQNAQ